MKLNYLELQIATESASYPTHEQFQNWLDLALLGREQDSEVVIRLVDQPEMIALNQQYRHKQGATNILSFPFEAPDGMQLDLLGDLVICVPIILLEAEQQNKPLYHHWAHITVHGILHLLGYDHISEEDAERMEALEIEILQMLNIANPYVEVSVQ